MANIGALATFHDRIGIVDDTIKSLHDQLDLLMIYCNDQESYDALVIRYENVKKFHGPDINDRGKFAWCGMLKNSDNIYFTFDDDLIYPPDYVQKTLSELNKYGNRAVVGYHGKKLLDRNIKRYYVDPTEREKRYNYAVLYGVPENQVADIMGTGCMAFDLRYFCPDPLKEDMMTDIEVSCMAEYQKKNRIVIAHPPGWVTYNQKMKGRWTVWNHFQTESDKRQVELLNQYFK